MAEAEKIRWMNKMHQRKLVESYELFDSVEAERLKREGMKRAAEKRQEDLADARHIARATAEYIGRITIDDIQRIIGSEPFPIELGNAAGSIFKERKNGKSVWKFTGNWVASKRTSNHGRMIREWELRERTS